MPRLTRVEIDATALLHNLKHLRTFAPQAKIVAMVKGNAYGCGLSSIAPVLEGHVERLGVATLGEGLALRRLGIRTPVVIFQGVFTPADWEIVAAHGFECVMHQAAQLQWLLAKPLAHPMKIWVKVNTGMNRLGFQLAEVPAVLSALTHCEWVEPVRVLMTHFANADEPADAFNMQQYTALMQLKTLYTRDETSVENSAALFKLPISTTDWVRPGLALYGVSPFAGATGLSLGLRPVMRLYASLMQVFTIDAGESVGYGRTWVAQRQTRVGVVSLGYGDGYPRVVPAGTPVWIRGALAPIIGRVSMETLTVDLTDFPAIEQGEEVELWGAHLPIERIAAAVGTIPYELMSQVRPRLS